MQPKYSLTYLCGPHARRCPWREDRLTYAVSFVVYSFYYWFLMGTWFFLGVFKKSISTA